jgi:hypothetical protein
MPALPHIDPRSMSAEDQQFENVSPNGAEMKVEDPMTEDLFETARKAFFGNEKSNAENGLVSRPAPRPAKRPLAGK